MRQRILAGIILSLTGVTSNADSLVYHYDGQVLDPLDSSAPPYIVAAVPTSITSALGVLSWVRRRALRS